MLESPNIISTWQEEEALQFFLDPSSLPSSWSVDTELPLSDATETFEEAAISRDGRLVGLAIGTLVPLKKESTVDLRVSWVSGSFSTLGIDETAFLLLIGLQKLKLDEFSNLRQKFSY